MTPTIDLSDEIFSRLQRFAIPLVDTPQSVISRALDALEAGDEQPPRSIEQTGPRTFNPAAAPNLSHTTPRRAEVAGRTLSKGDTYWNPILFAVIHEAAKKGNSAEDILDLLTIPSLKGKKEGNGYRFLEEVGVSVQGQDANNAWKQAYRIASSFGIEVQVTFIWQDTPKAAMPSVMGSFYVEG